MPSMQYVPVGFVCATMESFCRYVEYVLVCRVCAVMLSTRNMCWYAEYAEFVPYVFVCRVCVCMPRMR